MSGNYDIKGRPMTLDEFCAVERSDPNGMWQRAHRKTTVPEADAEVSTVWLGMDHAWGGGPPLIFESMVFGGNLDQEQVRYSTLAQAHAGHDDLVARVRAEADAFRELTVDPMVRDCVTAIEKVVAEHRAAFDLSEYGDLYAALVRAVTT
jgi:hypothetical protein